MVTTGQDFTARVWDAQTGRQLAYMGGHTREVGTASFLADDELVITTSGDGTARLWSASNRRTDTVLPPRRPLGKRRAGQPGWTLVVHRRGRQQRATLCV